MKKIVLILHLTSNISSYANETPVSIRNLSGEMVLVDFQLKDTTASADKYLHPLNKVYKKIVDPAYKDNFKNIIKIYPLKLVEEVNPSLELGWERRIQLNGSAQVRAGYLLPSPISFNKTDFSPHLKGFHLS